MISILSLRSIAKVRPFWIYRLVIVKSACVGAIAARCMRVNPVVDWERRIEIENEKQKNHRPETSGFFATDYDLFRIAQKSTIGRFNKLSKDRILSVPSSQPA